MLTETDRVRPVSDVVMTELETKDAVLLNLTTKQYFSLNPTGAHIWHLLGPDRTLAEVGTALVQRFDVTQEQAGRSVMALVNQLYTEKLVEMADD